MQVPMSYDKPVTSVLRQHLGLTSGHSASVLHSMAWYYRMPIDAKSSIKINRFILNLVLHNISKINNIIIIIDITHFFN